VPAAISVYRAWFCGLAGGPGPCLGWRGLGTLCPVHFPRLCGHLSGTCGSGFYARGFLLSTNPRRMRGLRP
jgi:hypothetical protein